MFPEITHKWEGPRRGELRADMELFTKLELGLGLMLMVFLAVFARPLLLLVSTPEFLTGAPVIWIFTAVLPLLCLNQPLVLFLRAVGNIWYAVITDGMWLAVYLVLGTVFVKVFHLGLPGFVLGQPIASVIVLAYSLAVFHKLGLPRPPLAFFLKRLALSAVVWVLSATAGRALPPLDWWQLVLIAARAGRRRQLPSRARRLPDPGRGGPRGGHARRTRGHGASRPIPVRMASAGAGRPARRTLSVMPRVRLATELPSAATGLLDRAGTIVLFHQPRWIEAMRRAYPRFRPAHLVLEEDGAITGVLPVLEKHVCGLGEIVSNPFGTYGGPILDANATREGVRALAAAFLARARRLGVFRFEMSMLDAAAATREDLAAVLGDFAVPEQHLDHRPGRRRGRRCGTGTKGARAPRCGGPGS